MARNTLVYLSVVGLFVAGIAGVLRVGAGLAVAPPAASATATDAVEGPPGPPDSSLGVLGRLGANARHPLALMLLQVVVIVVAAKLVGALCGRIGQPPVIGEMLAGILLGPSLLGWLWPGSQALIFPASSMDSLRLLSQIGVILFMFVVGLELDLTQLRHRSRTAVWVSHASILVPFFLGSLCALAVYRSLAPAGVPFSAFALFLGIAMSITAFPVLARIIEERGLGGTALGATAIACAAVDDVTAWCVLAAVVAIVKADALTGALVTVLLAGAFIAFMLLAVKPLTTRWFGVPGGGEQRAKSLLAGALSFLFLSALATEVIGIHALFGAFLAGVAMPADAGVRAYLKSRLEALGSIFLLPLFFAFTGLRTEVGLLADPRSWLICLALIVVAITGKLAGSMLAARATGLSWNDSFALGALMNTRGLVELIVLNLGYDLGILSPSIFTMLVLMALATTFMTGPLLALHQRWKLRASRVRSEAPSPGARLGRGLG